MIPFVRACVDSRYEMVVGVMASQVGKTDGQLNVVGCRLDDDPAPVLWVGPTRKNVEQIIEPRFDGMVRSCRSLAPKLATGKDNTKTLKKIAGTTFRLAWAGSATELASDAAALVMVDERDRMKDIPGEGDPVGMAKARVATFADGLVVVSSSPSIGSVTTYEEGGLERWEVADPDDIHSPVWALWQQGTRHEWAWPCPECDKYFIPRFRLLWWPEKATPAQAKREARLACPNCGSLLEDHQKPEMNRRGREVAPGQTVTKKGTVKGQPPETDTYSLWVSGLASPWRTWGQAASEWLKAVRSGSPGKIQVELNTTFGELYSVAGEAMDWQLVANKRRDYKFDQVPAFTRKIIMTVDVQKDRFFYTIRGWGAGMESALIRHGELIGETEYDDAWNELDAFRDVEFDGRRIDLCLVDSGYRPGDSWRRPDNQIYAFCRRHRGWARAVKGQPRQDKPIRAARIDVTLRGKTYKKGLQLWHVDTDNFKSWVHARLEWPDNQPGDWHLPIDADDDYCRQIVSETRVPKPSGAVVWVRLRKNNHYLDCEMMQAAGAQMLQIWRLRGPGPEDEAQAEEEPEPDPKKKTARKKGKAKKPPPLPTRQPAAKRKEKPKRRRRRPVSIGS